MIRTSIIICTFNRGEALRKTLENMDRLILSSDISLEILVVDNNSSDNTKEVVERYVQHSGHNVRYLFEINQGKSYALNHGVKVAKGDIIAFTDDDVYVRPDWILNIIKAFENTSCSCVGGKILLRLEKSPPNWLDDKLMEQYGLLDLGDSAFLLKKPKLYGANFAVSRSVFAKHGDFDVNLGPKAEKMHNNEDVCFIEKLINGGEKVMYSPDVVVEHVVPSKHIEKSYFRKRMFYQGEISGFGEMKNGYRNVAGIPLYIFKDVLVTALKCIYDKINNPVESFQKEVYLAKLIGFISGRLKHNKST